MTFATSKDDPQVYLVFDVESLGLHGSAYAWAGTLLVDGKEVRTYRCAVDPAKLKLSERDSWGLDWAEQHVLPSIRKWDSGLTDGVGLGFSQISRDFNYHWSQLLREFPEAYLVADCCFPVETNFLSQAVINGTPVYPLLDVSTLLLAAGENPIANFRRRDNELPAHDPLADARQSARIWLEMLERVRPGWVKRPAKSNS